MVFLVSRKDEKQVHAQSTRGALCFRKNLCADTAKANIKPIFICSQKWIKTSTTFEDRFYFILSIAKMITLPVVYNY
jgi:hypothetical protein